MLCMFTRKRLIPKFWLGSLRRFAFLCHSFDFLHPFSFQRVNFRNKSICTIPTRIAGKVLLQKSMGWDDDISKCAVCKWKPLHRFAYNILSFLWMCKQPCSVILLQRCWFGERGGDLLSCTRQRKTISAISHFHYKRSVKVREVPAFRKSNKIWFLKNHSASMIFKGTMERDKQRMQNDKPKQP